MSLPLARAKWAFIAAFSSIVGLTFVYQFNLAGWGSAARESKVLEAEGVFKDCPKTTCSCPELNVQETVKVEEKEEEKVMPPWDSSLFLEDSSAPTKGFRENLLPDKYYLTSWAIGGFSNQFIAYVNMIYLATLSNRIPIIPPFTPYDHIGKAAGIIYFGDIFNLTHLHGVIKHPILEWRNVKKTPPPEDPYFTPVKEHLGCWSTRDIDQQEPFNSENMLNHLGLDVSYTRVPPDVRREGDHKNLHVIFSSMAALTYPINPSHNASDYPMFFASPMRFELGPESQMACFDFLYYATSGWQFEWEKSWSPAWNIVGKNLPFTDRMIKLGKSYLESTFGIASDTNVTPFIIVHARRGDFARQCFNTPGECLPPLAAYAEKVKEIQDELLVKKGIVVKEVILTSDEKDPTFWTQAHSLGWVRIDHDRLQTESLYGAWYPAIIDIVVQSMAVGMVGTIGSTYSLVSERRVQDWNAGVYRIVQTGIW